MKELKRLRSLVLPEITEAFCKEWKKGKGDKILQEGLKAAEKKSKELSNART